MIPLLNRGRLRPHTISTYVSDGPIRLDEAKLSAWALALGQSRQPEPRSAVRPHRGQLSDVDAANVFRVRRRHLLGGLLACVGFGGAQAQPAAPVRGRDWTLTERQWAHYILSMADAAERKHDAEVLPAIVDRAA